MSKIKFGLRIPAFPVDGSNGTTFIKQTLNFIRDLEKFFDSAWVSDHFIPWGKFVPETTPNLEGFTAVCHLSGVFQNLMFGNIVLCNSYRSPAILAKMGATLQALTEGRFILGIGAGWKQDEYEAYGYAYPDPKARIKQLEEAVQIIKKMWTEEKATFKGRFYCIEEAVCSPKPEPVPPIMMGGGGEQLTLRAVARHADWWNLANTSPETFKHKLDVLKKHSNSVGRNPDNITKTLANMVAIAETETEAIKLAFDSPYINMDNRENYIIGDPETVTAKISQYTDLGVEYFILRYVDFPRTDGAKLFVKEVTPTFK